MTKAKLSVPMQRLRDQLEKKYDKYCDLEFIQNDPIQIPHRFDLMQDREIIGFWTAVLAWGQRVTIINKANLLVDFMDGAPYDFVCNYEAADLKRFADFKHRTFNYTDTLYFLHFFQQYYREQDSLEQAFAKHISAEDRDVEKALIGFHEQFFSYGDFPQRTKKHIATPARKSACKRINMFLRWMVRNDGRGVDFGDWKQIKMSQLVCPLDVHVERVGRHLGLIQRKQRDWLTAQELTANLRLLDPEDPVKYDYALFSMGVLEKDSLI